MKWAGALLLALAVGVDVLACAAYATTIGATNDLFPRWVGTRLWLQYGVSPYSPLVDQGVQAVVADLPGREEDPFVFGFVYPAYVALLLAPLALLPFWAAATLWLLLLQACCLGGALACWRATEAEASLPAARPWPALALATLFPATVINLIFLQFSALVFAAAAGAWLLLRRRREVLGGVVLALGVVKPALAILPVLALVAGEVRRRRWRALASGGVAALALTAVSLVALPGWPVAFWRSTVNYAQGANPVSAGSLVGLTVTQALGGGDGGATAAVIGAAVALAAGGIIVGAWCRSQRTLGAALQAGTLAGAWFVPPLYEWNNVLLLVVLVPVLRRAMGAGQRATRVAIVALASVVIAGSVTAWGYVRWPSETRLLWPTLALASYCVPRWAARGTYSVTERSGELPSIATEA